MENTNTTIERRSFAATDPLISLRADIQDGKRAGGYAAVYRSESVDLGGFTEVLAPGAFKRSLDAVEAGEAQVYLFWQHNSGEPLASTRSETLTLREDQTGLAFEFELDGLDDKQRKAIKRGDLQVSFGFRALADTWEERADGTYLRTVTDLELSEVSLVTYPAYGSTTVALRSRDAWLESQSTDETIQALEEEVNREDELRKARDEAWAVKRVELLQRFADSKIVMAKHSQGLGPVKPS